MLRMLRTNSKASLDENLQYIIDYYGEVHQEEKAIEEMAELTQALIKSWQCDDEEELYTVLDNIHEELADVCVMVSQLLLIYDADAVKKNIEMKIERTLERIRGEETE